MASSDRSPTPPPRLSPSDVNRHSFETVRRGFDPEEVRAYLEVVARELAAWEARAEELREQLADAEERARNPVIDEAKLSAALGQQSAQVLRKAHDEAARLVRQAEERSAVLVHEAQQQSSDVLVRAESAGAERIADAELSASSVHQQSEQEATRILEGARSEGESLVAQARDQGRAMLEEAQAARKRVLSDLAQRRRGLLLQIEAIRAARDKLTQSVLAVRDSVDDIVGDLARADNDARAAAAAATSLHLPAHDHFVESLDAEAPAIAAEAIEAEDAAAGPAVTAPAPDVPPAPVEGLGAVPGSVTASAPDEAPPAPVAEWPPVAAPTPVHAEVVEVVVQVDGDPVLEASLGSREKEESRSVDELFARIRASTDLADRARPDEDTPSGGVPPVDAEVPVSGENRAYIERRAVLLDPITSRLARRLKRILQDDQNQLLHRLRAAASKGGDVQVLLPEEEHRARFAQATQSFLGEAMAAGFAYVAQVRDVEVPEEVDEQVVRVAAESLAATVVTLLRRRLVTDAGELDGDLVEATERIGAAYREWRGERIERLVGDHALGTFSAGVVAGNKGGGLRWVVTARTGGCADCDDNALAELVDAGEEFPTGHRHPPAHAGCRCLIVPTPA